MYDIRQFKPTLYVLILMGMVGYAMAAESPGFFLFPTMLVILNAWLVKTGRFAPLPRWIANSATLLCLLWAGMQVPGARQSVIVLVIGQFLVLLQLVKLYEQRANRDYAQLLVLSLLLMVASSINTASLVFGLLLIIYLFLSLYCCLLFHLKVDTEHARSAMALPDSPRTELTLRQDQRNLTRSMRRLTILVSCAAITTAIIVFLFFPRNVGAGLLGPLQLQPSQALTGFSDQISFQRIAAITQNQTQVAYVRLSKNGKAVQGTQTLLLRGITFDVYNGNDTTRGQWQWSRSPLLNMKVHDDNTHSSVASWISPEYGPGDTEWKQEITLSPTGTPAIFAMAGAYAVSSTRADLNIRQGVGDEILLANEPINSQMVYTVLSRGSLANKYSYLDLWELRRNNWRQDRGFEPDSETVYDPNTRGPRYALEHSQIDPAVAAYALRPEVTGGLAAKRNPKSEVTDLDEDIATAIEKHLQTQFTYTLDLTDSKILNGQDPMAWFLSPEGRRGHCEYFAGAMTLMCQSLGMQARVVAGFKCDEYNPMSKQYQVRQSHAHAWVEVLTRRGWVTFDPTSGRETPKPGALASAWQTLKYAFNYLEFSWAKNVVAYDNDNRENLVSNLNSRLTNSAIQGSDMVKSFRDWLQEGGNMIISFKLLSGFVGLMVIVLLVAIIFFVFEKYRLRRRAVRIGLDALPASDQLKLARQLGFYDDLMQLLEKHQITRPSHLTPQEFSDSLTYLPAETFQTIRRLTVIFYHIRYGRRELTAPRQKRLGNVIGRLQHFMQSGSSQSSS